MIRKPHIAVVGAGRDVEPAVSHARELGRLIAENGWVLITGGRNTGVMDAANEGAKEVEGSQTIGILPDGEAEVSPSVDIKIITDTGEARNNIIVLSAQVVIACGVDGAGTASEVALALKNKRPVILLGASRAVTDFFLSIDTGKIYLAATPDEAVETARGLIRSG